MDDIRKDENSEAVATSSTVHPARLGVFAALSAGFIIWVTLGQIEARVWVSGQLTLLDRRISTMWQYLGNNLPDLPAPGLFSTIYWISISFIVIGTIAGLWLFLGTPDDDVNEESLESIHAAHLQHESK